MNCSRLLARAAVICILLLAVVPALAKSAATKPALTPESCRAYVQKFYDWYVPAMFHEGETPASDRALDRKEFSFSEDLRKQLREDLTASRKNKDEIVGLDFDPFVNSQDPYHRYVVGKVAIKDGHCFADVHGMEAGKRSAKPEIVPELELKAARWIFVNFHYPNQPPPDSDLLSVLKTLREERR